MKKLFTPRVILVSSLIFTAIFFRLIPHIPNFTPVAAIALFGGTYLGKKYLSFLIPFVAMLLSDAILGFHSTMIAVYVSFALVVGIGMLLRKKTTFSTVIIASLASSILFFVITNFGSWMSGMMPYPMTFSGLMMAYEAGLPFFRNELAGTLVFSGVFFGSFYLAQVKFPVLRKA